MTAADRARVEAIRERLAHPNVPRYLAPMDYDGAVFLLALLDASERRAAHLWHCADSLLAEVDGQGGTYAFTRDNLRKALATVPRPPYREIGDCALDEDAGKGEP